MGLNPKQHASQYNELYAIHLMSSYLTEEGMVEIEQINSYLTGRGRAETEQILNRYPF